MTDDRLDQLDYYDLLQVDPGASTEQVRQAFHAFARKFHPDRFAGAPDEKQARAAHIYRRGAEAYRVLSDPGQRATYDVQLGQGKRRYDAEAARKERLNSPEPLTAGPQVRSARARPFVEKAREALEAGRWTVARLNLQIALGHEPGHRWLTAQLAEVERKIEGR